MTMSWIWYCDTCGQLWDTNANHCLETDGCPGEIAGYGAFVHAANREPNDR